MNLAVKIMWPDPAQINSEASTTLAFYLPIGVFIAGQQGPAGPAGPIDPTLSERIDEIYLAGQTAITNGSYSGGVLSWTGGTIASPFGLINGVSLTLPASTTINVAANLAALTGNQVFIALWHHMASASDALADYLSTYMGLVVQVTSNDSMLKSDNVDAGTLADTVQSNIRLVGKHLVSEIDGIPNSTIETAETSLAQPEYLHIFVIDLNNGAIPDATIGFDGNGLPGSGSATGLLPDEIAARISGDVALQAGLDALTAIVATKATSADITALRDELLETGGGSTVSNGTYDGSTLHYTGGEVATGSGVFGGFIDQAGAHSIELVVPDFQGSAQIIYFVNDTPSLLANPSPENLFYGGFGLNQSNQLPTFMAVVFPDSGVDPQAIFRDVAVGDIIGLTISNNNSTLTVTLNGTEIWSATTTKVLAETYTHLIFSKTVESDTLPDIQVSGLAADGTPGLIDTLIHAQVDPVVTAQVSIYQRLSAVESVNTAQNTAISNIQTLAETNQLNISERVLQTDFDTLSQTVADNGLLIAQKASQSDLTTLTTEVATKATASDISAAIAALVDGAPASLDTLAKIATALAGDQASINDLLTQINNRVRFDAAQSLTTAQQLQARQNISAEAVGVAAALVAAITAASIGAATALQGSKADSALQSGDVAPVALSGSYTDLSDKPTLFDLSSLLTGLGAGSNTAITAADSLINALAKLQAQVSTNATNVSTNAANIATNSTLITSVRKKIGGAWYVSGRLYDCVFPFAQSLTAAANGAGTQVFFPMQILENGTFDQITVNVSTVGADSSLLLGIYDSDSQNMPNTLLVKSTALDSTTMGQKTFSINQSFVAGQVIWLSLLTLTASVSFTAIAGSALMAFRGHTSIGQLPVGIFYKSSQADMTANAGSVSESRNVNFPRIMLRSA